MALHVIGITTAHTGTGTATSLSIAAPAGTQASDMQVIVGANISPSTAFDWSSLSSQGWRAFEGWSFGAGGSTSTRAGTLMMFRRGGPTGSVTLPVSGSAGHLSAVRITLRSDSGRYSTDAQSGDISSTTAFSNPMPAIPIGSQGSLGAPENLMLGVPGIVIQVLTARLSGGTLSISGPAPSTSAVAASSLARTAVWLHNGVRNLAAATVSSTSSGTLRSLGIWIQDPGDVPPPTTSNYPEGEYLITGPLGDPSVFATENYPGGVVEPGWPKGLRHGYAQIDDTGFLVHESREVDEGGAGGPTEFKAAAIVPLDCVYSVIAGQWEDYPYDAIKVAILKRVDDTLVDVVRDFSIDGVGAESYTSVTLDACLLSFEDDVGYVAIAYYSASAYLASPEGFSLRVTIIKVDLTGQDAALSVVASTDGFGYTSGTDGVHRIIRLSDTRCVIAYLAPEDPSMSVFSYDGSEYTSPYFPQIGVRVLEFNPTSKTISPGPVKKVGFRVAGANLCRVDDSRFVLVTMDENRTVIKDRAKIPGSNSFYRAGLHVRTCDVGSDLAITENLSNSSINAELRAGFNGGKATPFMLDDRLVVAFPVWAAFTPQLLYHESTDTFSPGIQSSILENSNGDGKHVTTSFAWSGVSSYDEPVPVNVGMKLFDLTEDGGVTPVEGPTHILDASGTAFKNAAYYSGEMESNFSTIQMAVWMDPVHAEVANGTYALVSWGAAGSSGLGIMDRELRGVYVATVVHLDDSSPTGLHASGFRHLGQEAFIGDGYGIQDVLRPRNLPGTDYFIGCASTNAAMFVDGVIEGGAELEGYPENFAQEDDFGYYHWGVNGAVLYDEWDEYNRVDLRTYGEYPGSPPEGDPNYVRNRDRYTYDLIARVDIWDMTHKVPGSSDPSEQQVRIMRGKSKR